MKAPISVCLIVKNDPFLETCIKSFRDYVNEIVIVDTGSTDGTAEVAKRLADKFESYTDCNDPETGVIDDFSMARQRSFDLATQPWVMWADSDDLITGAENLLQITQNKDPNADVTVYMFPYEYAYDETGKCICLHYRERLVSNKNKVHWINPVHEVFVPNDGASSSFVVNESVIYQHKRQYNPKAVESGRNLRILRKYFAKVGDTDARQMYYLGLECFNNGLVDEAIQHLSKYIDISGWDDERAMACLKLIEICLMRGDYDNGLKWAFKTVEIKEEWGEGYFALAKMFYYIANRGGPNAHRYWEKCAYFAKLGLSLPPTKTFLFVNPLDREYDIHRYLNVALSKIGNSKEALQSVNTGLRAKPNDPELTANKNLYEVWINKHDAIVALNNLKSLGQISDNNYPIVESIINRNDSKFSLKEEWKIPQSCNFETLPTLSDDQLQCSIIMLWKQLMMRDEFVSAASFLANLPEYIKNTSETEKASKVSKLMLGKNEEPKEKEPIIEASSSGLDIVFFAGDGVEIWTPETVKKTGIGGSELMMLEMAKRLASLGHKVRVYNSCGIFGSGVYDGVTYLQTNKYKDLTCDVLIVSRRADMLSDHYNIKAKLKLLWVHDIFALNATNELLLKADRILALSQWHKSFLMDTHNLHSDHIIVTRNGINLERFNKKVKRNKFKCVNSSSPDRSWPVLLEVWEDIRKQVPQAELHLYYGFKNWEYAAQFDKGQADLIVYLKKRIKDLENLGVVYHDRVSQEELAEEFLSAGAWIYPTWFTETSCITAMEAQAAGLRMVTSSIAALNETVGSRGVLLDGKWTDAEYKEKFVRNVVKSLNNYSESDRLNLQQHAKNNFGLDPLAKDWEKMFYDLLEEVKTNPIVPYQPTKPYTDGSGYFNGDTRLPEDNPERRKVK